MKILAIETATETCSAALYQDGAVLERSALAPREHARLILPMVDALLAEAALSFAALDALAFGRGPGGFTGVRIATAVIQGLAFGAGLPVVPVSTLGALAQGALRESGYRAVLAALDARMDEVYWGAYRAGPEGVMAPVEEECVCRPAAVPVPSGTDWHGIGSGFDRYGDELQRHLGTALSGWTAQRAPQAWDVAVLGAAGWRMGQAVAAEAALPVYLRDRVVGDGGR
ncbi:MAG: tRNA (adenosine(37)-N6)-threonylcarbamoyltransferase complex dimerization subunit type 1 TsaB [Chromatiales bacterium 21-64-14]|nr:MAG: tRNA (adenosine(37)-N6)-threonylcarbamoyltransferase complex dimerization subunit type 1 TsaB [Chromatiales bacterium 21-64-14]HQU15153.1 tRNA (adenosine(37)-N6)-threonylcarbamoyltransferase complex dimerization subunit type 1 TsaB [Gammaproteobacteria bacterium]